MTLERGWSPIFDKAGTVLVSSYAHSSCARMTDKKRALMHCGESRLVVNVSLLISISENFELSLKTQLATFARREVLLSSLVKIYCC